MDKYKPEVDEIISNFSYKKGKSYAEYVQGDKVAKYGLTALIAGGAAATASKFGLFKILAKAWKLVIIAVIGFFAALKNKIKSLFSGKQESVDRPGQTELLASSLQQNEDSDQDSRPDGQ